LSTCAVVHSELEYITRRALSISLTQIEWLTQYHSSLLSTKVRVEPVNSDVKHTTWSLGKLRFSAEIAVYLGDGRRWDPCQYSDDLEWPNFSGGSRRTYACTVQRRTTIRRGNTCGRGMILEGRARSLSQGTGPAPMFGTTRAHTVWHTANTFCMAIKRD